MLTSADCRAHAEETDIGSARGVIKWVFVPRWRATCDVCGRRPNLPCNHHNCPLYRATSDRTIMPFQPDHICSSAYWHRPDSVGVGRGTGRVGD
jgi:hypothetical protein